MSASNFDFSSTHVFVWTSRRGHVTIPTAQAAFEQDANASARAAVAESVRLLPGSESSRRKNTPVPSQASRLRFRPILMTSFAFILGIFPLVNATGAGAASRQSLGTAVFGGMLAATILAVFFVPVFYVLMQRISEFIKQPAAAPVDAPHAPTPEEPQVTLHRVERGAPLPLDLAPTHA